MSTVFSRIFSGLCFIGFLAGACAYAGSFMHLRMEDLRRGPTLMNAGIVGLIVCGLLFERIAMRRRRGFMKSFTRSKPAWTFRVLFALVALLVVSVLLYPGVYSDLEAQYLLGSYVLTLYGKVKTILTEAQYYHYKGSELRAYASAWMLFYFFGVVYWGFTQRAGGSKSRRSSSRGLPHG